MLTSRIKQILSATLAMSLTFGTAAALGDISSVFADTTEPPTVKLDENIMLSVFWPPTPDYINDEQYSLMAEAGINWVMGSGEETLATVENQKKMLALCEKYGIKMIANDSTLGSELSGKSEEYVASQVSKYFDYSSLGGFYIKDEPYNPNEYVDIYTNLKKAFPDGYMHLNFFTSAAYISDELYKGQMNDWCRLCAANGYPVDYLIYDRYPFGLQAGTMDRTGFYSNMRAVHDVGLENGVRTGTYIQTVKQSALFRRPTASEIRYEMYSSLAFGFKQLSFFTWFTPVNRNEPFEDGIISPTGVPNEHYEYIKEINKEILAIGSTLVKCDALEVYLNGSDTYDQPYIPDDFFVQPQKNDQSYTVSFLKHKETGRNYLMVVNNDFTNASEVDLTFDSSITALSSVSRVDGSLSPVELDGGKLHLELAAGDAAFFALPEGLDFDKSSSDQPSAKTNLASDVLITAVESVGKGGYYLSFLSDGKRFAEDGVMGWRSTTSKDISLNIDLKNELSFNRIDLYPEGTLFEYGEFFPEEVSVSVSTDGNNYTEVTSVQNIGERREALSIVLLKSEKARYIRLDLSKCRGEYVSLCEIEIYNDDGSVPAPEVNDPLSLTNKVISYKEGQDLAFKKPVYPSSTTPEEGFREWGWAADFINNGVDGQGWTSNVKLHDTPDATEYIIIDLCDMFAVDKVVVKTRGVFPKDFRIEMSTDGKEWSEIVSKTNAREYKEGTMLTFTPPDGKGVVGRFLRFIGTRLRDTSNSDGYMLQLGNISAYGLPYTDKTELSAAVKEYEDRGGDLTETKYQTALKGVENEYLTQSQADAYTKALLRILPEVAETLPESPSDTNTEIPINSDDNSKKNRTPLIIGLSAGALIIVGAAAAVIVITKQKRNKKKKDKE